MELEAEDGAGAAAAAPEKERIYVGGLGEHVSEADLHKILSSIGARVDTVDIIRTKGRSFAYIDFVPASDKALAKLFSTYNGCVWKGGKLRLERAKEHYLARLRREWDEDAEIAPTVPSKDDDVDKHNASPEKPSKKLPSSEQKQLQIYFPRLRKMKSIPFSGTGKHRYSFQRVQVPSLPVHFCDCEEHAVPFHIEKEKHTPDVLAQDGGVEEEEFNIMNSVMNKLFKRENESNVLDKEPRLAEEEDQSHENKSDGETDEDNLIINMVATGNSGPTLLEGQKQERNLRNKESKFNKRQASKDWPTENPLKVQKRDLVTAEKKTKLLPNEQISDNEFVSAIPGSKGGMQNQTNESGMFLGAQSYEPESGIQSTSNLSWSQKNSWKELIGNRDNSTFSVSKILPSIGSAKDGPTKKSPKVQKKDTVSPVKKRKVHVNKRSNDEIISAIPESKGSMLNHSDESELLLGAQLTEPESGIQQSNTKSSGSQKSPSKELVAHEDDGTSSDSKVLPGIGSANKEQQRSDYVSAPISTENKSQKLVSHDKAEGQACTRQELEVLADAQPPAKQDTDSNKSGRGAAWLKKSSWTQLIRESNTTFSISQILPGISYEKQELPKTKNTDVANSMVQEKSESINDGYKGPEFGKGPILSTPSSDASASNKEHDLASFNVLCGDPEKNLQTIPGNHVTSAPKRIPKEDSLIGETCQFMRSATSMKEWANTKAALSKRKGKEK